MPAERVIRSLNQIIDMNGSNQYVIESIEETQEFATQWQSSYNIERPNTGIGGTTPVQKLKMAA